MTAVGKDGGGNAHRGWYKHGNLPHYDAANAYQSITYRLADSLPKAKLDEINRELRTVNPKKMETERRKKIEKWLDSGHGSCMLRNPDNAWLVINAWKYFDGVRYNLIAWVVMPNHVHVLAHIVKGWPLGEILKSWKRYTSRRMTMDVSDACSARAVNDGPEAGIPNKPKVWQDGYWDRYIRDEAHFHRTILYIEYNPVAAGLVKQAEDWPFGSAGERASRDASRAGSPVPGTQEES